MAHVGDKTCQLKDYGGVFSNVLIESHLITFFHTYSSS